MASPAGKDFGQLPQRDDLMSQHGPRRHEPPETGRAVSIGKILSKTEKKMENRKQETGNWKLVNSAGFTFPVFGFRFSIPFLFGSGSAGLGRAIDSSRAGDPVPVCRSARLRDLTPCVA
jgi:hypothetical protein